MPHRSDNRSCLRLERNHFSPCEVDTGEAEVTAATDHCFGAVAGLLPDVERCLCGIGSKDPGYLSEGHALELLPMLQRHFEHVEIMWAERFEEEFEKTGSLGGMMAVISCSVPRRPRDPASPSGPGGLERVDSMDCNVQRT